MTLKIPSRKPPPAEVPVREAPSPPRRKALPVVTEDRPPSVVAIIDEVLNGKNKREHFFRPSMVSGCSRANVYHYIGAPDSLPDTKPQLHRILDTGTALHSVVQDYIGSHRDVFFAPEVKVFDSELGVKGSCDGILIERSTGFRWALEIKTIGESGFKALTNGPKPEHVEQATIYMALTGVKWCSFLYVNKNNSSLKEFIVAFDENLWATLRARFEGWQEYVADGRTPPFSSKECLGSIDLCRYVEHCEGERGIKRSAYDANEE